MLIDFGIIVCREVIDTFPLGIVNSHFSLLPQLRGADPITFAILEGHKKTGVSLMMIDEGMDTGKLLTYRTLHIAPDDTTITLTEKLITLSDTLLRKHLPQYIRGEITPKNQPHPSRATYSRRLTKADGEIDLRKPALQLEREIRAYAGWPGSRMKIAGREAAITSAHIATTSVDNLQDRTIFVFDKQLCLQTSDGVLIVDSLKPAGKSEMLAKAFLAGNAHRL